MNSSETFVNCALRESTEEIGEVISELISADRTYWLNAEGKMQQIDLTGDSIRPCLVMEKRNHTGQGCMTNPNQSYYLVAFDAALSAKPRPSSEIAAILYLTDIHLSVVGLQRSMTLAELIQRGAKIECQGDCSIDQSRVLVPHGTAIFLIKQLS
ncbi:MAG: hypothetical protein Kow00121_05020 [Elainellaceae cyanobacterium]